jgi:CheY-like chemotaxis protein
MSIKHALVVDDSKSAQTVLKQQLEEHDLVVALAASGEEALEFLEHRSVDVIFMDHTMPGMDGLEALAAIKKNPRTATIPVMMYTAKEGEVYVGQARALGGIGVLPKNVQPHVLFDMLLQLGLVRDQRDTITLDADTPRRRASDMPADGQPRPERPAGIALESLVSRIMEDQAALHTELRTGRAALAREVAAEVVAAQRNERAATDDILLAPASPSAPKIWTWLTVLLAGAALIFALRAWDDGRSNAVPPPAPADDGAQRAHVSQLEAALRAEQTQAHARYFKAIDALQWAVNQHAGFPFDELPFDDTRAGEIRDLLERLVALNFQGRVRIESHLGEFCLVTDETGSYQLAPPDLPVESCTFVGHPQDNSASVADQQSVGFAEFFRSSPLVSASGIAVELVAHDRAHSLRRVPFPPDLSRAGDWNRIAERNNRLEYSLIPTGS